MNKYLYRVIFNKKRGMQIVVADIAKTPYGSKKKSKGMQTISPGSLLANLKQITFIISISLSFVSIITPVYGSDIIADPQANKHQKPQVISTANGITQVNIQTPNNKGVSHNKYSQFDVSQSGAILNNSSQNIQTQLAGYVQGNKNLTTTGSAKIILNEVNSRNPSQLNGVIEVAGQKAQVVIANPSGITCNGCGFINASRSTLTTGKPVIENGELRGYVVEGGNISVTGKGLDSSEQDYTDLIARTVSLNSAVWANDANVVTGRNQVSQDSQTVIPLEENTTNKPEVSIDVSQLGGMYAGKIRMVGTEKGVGVHNAGELGASAGNIIVSADGKITNNGTMQSKQNIDLTSQQSIANNKQIYSKQNIQLKSKKEINNQGALLAQSNINLEAKDINSTQNSTVVAGINEQGVLVKQGNINASANNIAFKGKNSAGQELALMAKENLNLDNSETYGENLTLTGESISLQSAHVQTEQQLNLTNSTSINTSSAIIQSKNGINLTTNTLTNNNSQLLSENDISLKAKQIDSNASSIYTNNKINVVAENITLNNATLSAKKAVSLSGNTLDADNLALTTEDHFTIAGKQVSTQNANIQAQNAINIDANDYIADNLNLVTAQSLTLKADRLQLNQSKISALANIDVSGKQLDNRASVWQSNQNISINADKIFNQSSQIKAIGSINYTFNDLNNDNATIVGKNLKFTGDTFYNQQAKLKSDEAITALVNQLLNHHAQWQGGDNTIVTATKLLDNQNGIIYSKGSLTIDTANMANDNAKLITDKDLKLHTKQLSSDNSVLQAAKTLNVAVDEQFNAKGSSLYANEQITINSNDIDLSKAELNSKQDILLLGQQQVLNQAKFLAGGQLKLNATNIEADDVSLKSINDLTIKSLNSATFNRGQLITNKKLSLNTQNAQTTNATLYAKGGIDVNSKQLVNQNAVWFSGATINLIAQSLDNQKSSIQAQQNVLINSEQINNAEGVIVADGSLTINATNLDNTSAQLQSKSGTKIQVNNELKNSNTKWYSESDIELNANNLTNDNAIVDSLGNMLITANNINNSQAKLYANKLININADNINNENSEFFANDSINFVSKILNNQNSDLKAKQNINIQADSLLSDLAKYVAEGDLSFNSQTASFNKAIIASKGNLSIDNAQALSMQEAQLVSQKNMQLKANTINSAGSLINSTGYIDVLTQHLINNNAQWVTKGFIKINTDKTENNNGFLQADNFISILANQLFNNDSGTLISKNNIELKSDEINNASGQVSADGHISIDSSKLKNNDAKLVAKDDIIIKATGLDNRSAQLKSDKTLNIDAKHIDNQKAIFSTKGNITVKADDLDNTLSKLFSGQSITINSDNIINKQAVLKADNVITIDSQQFDNSDATVVAENLIKLAANYLNNANAAIQSKNRLTMNSKQLDNQSALLLSGDDGTNIDAQLLNNQQAKLFTTGDLTINADTFANQGAKLVTEKSLTINTNQLNNQKAELQAKGDLSINANQLDNQQALFNSENNIQLIGNNGIDNRASQLVANGLIKLTSLNDINNANAKLLSNNGIALQAANLVNQSTVLKTNGLIKAEATNIDNRQSEYVANNIQLESNELNNQLASLTANNNLIINSKNFDNNQGHLLANNIFLKTKSFQGNGTIKSQNDLSLDLDDSLINDSELTANGHLSIRTAGDINNKNKITAGKQVTLDSQQLINEQQAEISADYISLKNKTLTNQGLIEGDTAVIQTNTLDNLSTGRIYADNLAIKTFTLNNRGQNGKAPVIAARNNFHLGVNTLNNYTHAQLLSLGNFVIGGDLDANYNVTGMAEVINNHAATIESQANLSIATKALNNTNDHIVTEMRKSDEAPEREEYFEVGGKIGKYSPDQILYRIRNKYLSNEERTKSLGCEKHDKGCWYLWKDIPDRIKLTGALSRIQIKDEHYSATNSYHYNIEKTKYRTVVLETDPGKIMASGNLIIQGQTLNNQDSKIVAGKTVNINVDQLNNHSQETIAKYVYTGKKTWHHKIRSKHYKADPEPYTKPDEVFIDDALNNNIQDHQIFTSTQLQAESRQTVAVQNTPNEVTLNNTITTNTQPVDAAHLTKPAVTLSSNHHDTEQQPIAVINNHTSNKVNPTLIPENNVEQNIATTKPIANPPKISDSEVASNNNKTEPAKTISVYEPNLTLPDNSLWIVNKDSDKNYVVETAPRFTQRKKWLSSDYMMQRLGADHDAVIKRLGDGYYEQQLIREQVIGLTGNRYLGNYHSDLEQYKALMDAGVSFAQAYGIVPGVELTPEQMQALTTDMVWLVKKTVTVNGQTIDVLVPQVYVVNRTKLDTDGALISGDNVFIKGKELNSNGLITAKQDVLLDGYNVTNKGTIYGNRVGINADNDINNYGKLVGNKLVYLDADHDVNLVSTTRTQTRDRNITTNVDQGSTIQVNNGDILINADHDINSKAGWIINTGKEGETWLQAGHDIQFTTADIEEKFDYRRKKDYRITDEKSVVGTQISAVNDIQLLAGNNINAKTVDIAAGNHLGLQAGNDINIGSSTETSFLDEFHKEKKKGFLSSTKTTSHVVEDNTTQKGSELSGDTVTINAGNNLNVTGSQVVATNDVNLKAGKDINIDAAEESYYRFEQQKTKKSGFSASKKGVSYGSQSSKLTSTQNETNHSATTSLIGTSGGNVIIDAGNQVTINSSDIVAGRAKGDTNRATGHIDISGEDIVIIPGQDTVDKHTSYKAKSNSIGISFSNPIVDGVRNIRDIFKSDGNNTEKSKLLVQEIAAIGMDIGLPTQLPITYSHSSTKSESTLHGEYQHGSSLTAAGNIQLHATKGKTRDEQGKLTHGDVLISGSQLSAGEAIIIDANRDINIVTSTDKQNEETKTKNKNWSVTDGAPTAGSTVRFLSGGPNHGTGLLPYGSQSSSNQSKNEAIAQTPSELTANSIYINSHEGSVQVSGSNITAIEDLQVKAKQGDIAVTTGTNWVHNEEKGRSKTFGELGGDGYSGTIGWQDSRYKNLEDSTNQNNIRSELNSLKGNVSLEAGGDIQLAGADIMAGKSVDLTGKNVLMDVGEDSVYQKYKSKNSQYGVTVSASGYAVTAAKSIEKAANAIENHEDKRLATIYAAQAALNSYSSSTQASKDGMSSSLVKVKVSVTADNSKQSHEYENQVQSGTTIQAGQNVNINAKENIEGKGVDIQGKNVNLNAGQDIKFTAAQDKERIKNTDSGSHYGVGVGMSFGGGQNGFSLELSGSQSKGKENGHGEINNNSVIHARDTLNIHSGHDVTLAGAELQGNRVIADIGHDLLISSLQDKEDYQSKHTSAGVDASICVPPFCFGASQVSGNFSQDKMKSDYASVNEQSGIFAGEGGYDITVGNHTELTGAVIASEAEDKTHNRLDTGTIGFSDIKNKAEFKTSSISVGGGVSLSHQDGDAGKNGNKNQLTPTAGNPSVYEHDDKASSITHSAISEGELIVRDKEGQKQDINELSHDTDNAHHKLKPIFDKEKEQRKQEIVTGLKDLAGQVKQLEKELNSDAGKDSTKGKMGNDFSKGVDSAVAIVTGIITGDITGGLAGAGAPWVAEQIKLHTGKMDKDGNWQTDSPLGNLVAHAILGAVVAELQGNSALVGGASAVSGELAAPIIQKALYGDRGIKDLTEDEKENLSALTQLAVGLTIASMGGDSSDIVAGVNSSKNAVENNFLGPRDQSRLEELRKKRDEGFLILIEKIEMFLLDENDQKGDYLVAKFFNDPDSLTESQREKFEIIISRYYEQEKAQYGEEAANRALRDLLNGVIGYRPHNYDFPYLSYPEHQDQYTDAYWESVDPRNLPWYVKAILHPLSVRDKDANEEYFINFYAWEANNAAREWERQVGRPVMNFLPGGIGLLYNGIDTAQASYELGEVIGRLSRGEEFNAEMALKLTNAGFTLIPVATSSLIPKGGTKGTVGGAITGSDSLSSGSNVAGKGTTLPNGYTPQGTNVVGPRGGIYTNTGKVDAAGNPIYTNNGAYYTFENGAKTKVPSPNTGQTINGRPDSSKSETDVGASLSPDYKSQVSYKDGKVVPHGTQGSVRPDFCNGTTCSIEVKNYDIEKNINGLINNVSSQAIDRQIHLPPGMRQEVVIDVRGQNLTSLQEIKIRQGIENKTNGIINSEQIEFLKDKGVIK